MAPKAPEPAAAGALPSTTDFNALYNRISLAAAKQNTFLNSMRAKYPSLGKTQTSTPKPSPAAAPQTSGFSSLGPEAAAQPAVADAAPAKTKAQLRAEQEDAADPLRFDSPNAGLGYVPSKSEANADAATQDLSRRILGNRAREVKGRSTAGAVSGAKRRAAADEESDEDEGRSGLGRRKRARELSRRKHGEEEVDNGNNNNYSATLSPLDEAPPAPEPETGPEAVPEGRAEQTLSPQAAVSDLAGSKKRKKKKNKKKKKSQD